MLFLFHVVFNSFLMIPVVKDNAKLKLALTTPKGAPITLANEVIDIPPAVAGKTIKTLSR